MEPTELSPDDALRLDRYLAGESSPAEQEIVEQWVGTNGWEGEFLTALRAAVDTPHGDAGQSIETLQHQFWQHVAHTQRHPVRQISAVSHARKGRR